MIKENIKKNVFSKSRFLISLIPVILFILYILSLNTPNVDVYVRLAEPNDNVKFEIFYYNPKLGFNENDKIELTNANSLTKTGRIPKDKLAVSQYLRLDIDNINTGDYVAVESLTFKNAYRKTFAYNIIDNIGNINFANNVDKVIENDIVYLQKTGSDTFIVFDNTYDIVRGIWSGISVNIVIAAIIMFTAVCIIYLTPEQAVRSVRDELRKISKEKIYLSIAAGFAFSFNFLLYGMLHIFISNSTDLLMPFYIPLAVSLIAFLAAWIILSGLQIALPGKKYHFTNILTGLIIASYVQSNFLNNQVDIGTLTGDEIDWGQYRGYAIIGILIWSALILLPFLLKRFFAAKIWKQAIYIICILISGMQAAALITLYIQSRDDLKYTSGYYLSREGIYEVSSGRNVIIFVIDRLDYKYVEGVREDSPAFFDRLDGFVEFTNTRSAHEYTFPSGIIMTTGMPFSFSIPRTEYMNEAWNNSGFITLMKENNYTMKYHMPAGHMYSNYEQIKDVADNIRESDITPKFTSVTRNLLKLTAYRHSPLLLKPLFWLPAVIFDTDDMPESKYVTNNDVLFMELLRENGLTIQNDKNNYIYLHLNGSHPPYYMDEDCVERPSDVISQTKGCFNIVYAYMDEMKRLGVYDDATIIILGDHGDITEKSRHVGFFIKPSGAAGTPLTQNGTQISCAVNFLPTILASEGIDYEDFGLTIFEAE